MLSTHRTVKPFHCSKFEWNQWNEGASQEPCKERHGETLIVRDEKDNETLAEEAQGRDTEIETQRDKIQE